MFFKSTNNTSNISINGVNYSGNNVTVNGNKIIVDGNDVTPDSKEINISIEGDVEKIEVDYCSSLNVAGKVGSLTSRNGNVKCGDVGGDVETRNGTVTCGNIEGDVSTRNGSIKHRGRRD